MCRKAWGFESPLPHFLLPSLTGTSFEGTQILTCEASLAPNISSRSGSNSGRLSGSSSPKATFSRLLKFRKATEAMISRMFSSLPAGWPSARGCGPWPRSILPTQYAPLPDTDSAEILPPSSSTRISSPPANESSGSSCSPDAVWRDRLSQNVWAEPHRASLHDCA